MLTGNFVYGHANKITIGLISNGSVSSDFQTVMAFFRTSKYLKRCYESKIIRTTDRLIQPISVSLLKQKIKNACNGIR